jgi:hypothetical protein
MCPHLFRNKGSEIDEVTGRFRIPNDEELGEFYRLRDIIRLVKFRAGLGGGGQEIGTEFWW